jgi:hypothetical protein
MVTTIRLRQCLGCGNDAAIGSWYCPHCDRAARSPQALCKHLFFYWGSDYIEKKVGQDFFDTHRRPLFGECVECCRDCGLTRYHSTGYMGMAGIISAQASEAKELKAHKAQTRKERGYEQPLSHPWKMGAQGAVRGRDYYDEGAFVEADYEQTDLSDLYERIKLTGVL